MKILYLYSELMGYQIPVFREYVSKYKAEVHVIHWDHKKLTPYVPQEVDNVFYYNRSKYTKKELVKFVSGMNPDIVYISGWMDKGYLAAVKCLRKKNIPVVTMFDDIWWKTLRQKIASIFFPFIKKYFFSHAWVAGPFQYEYAKRLGFSNDEILFNSLSADIKIYNDAYLYSLDLKRNNYPHRFLFAGRIEKVKGIDLLLIAWDNIKVKRKDWELTIIGNGSLSHIVTQNSNVTYYNFMQPEYLARKIKDAGCYILPSIFEPWALVLHESSAAGLPIICSDICGAAPVFVIPGFNGFKFKARDVEDLANQMLKIINLTDQQLIQMSENSHILGQRITPEISASSFMSILNI